MRPPNGDTALERLRVAAVVDEFTALSIAPEVTLCNLDARAWRAQLQLFRPDVLFVESAWRGARGSWSYRLASYAGRHDDTLSSLIQHCRRRAIPTLFWNKEDPPHFERFAAAAALFDYVFTTDADKVQDYRRVCGLAADRVHVLPFAVQPRLYHPRNVSRQDVVCFAGSYGEQHFPQRRRDLEMLLDASSHRRLEIYDRNATLRDSEKAFPSRFAPYVRGALDYRDLAEQYRRCKVALNVNSVAGSPTMFSRRVFEMLACGACVVSAPSAAIDSFFGGIVATVGSTEEARAAIDRVLEDEAHRDRCSAQGILQVLAHHTYEHRLWQLLRESGLESARQGPPPIVVASCVRGLDEARFIAALIAETPSFWRAHVILRHLEQPMTAQAIETLTGAAPGRVVVTQGTDASEMMDFQSLARRVGAPYVACVAPKGSIDLDSLLSMVAARRLAAADVFSLCPGRPARGRAKAPVPPFLLFERAVLAQHGWSTRAEDAPELQRRYQFLRSYALEGIGAADADAPPAGG